MIISGQHVKYLYKVVDTSQYLNLTQIKIKTTSSEIHYWIHSNFVTCNPAKKKKDLKCLDSHYLCNHKEKYEFILMWYKVYQTEKQCSICKNRGFSSVQLLSCVRLFATPWTAGHQASMSIINSQSLLKLMSIEAVRPSNHLILCHPFSCCLQSFRAWGSFPMSQVVASDGQSIGVSASASVLPMNIQDWFPLGWTS